jgi:hypothetical protein
MSNELRFILDIVLSFKYNVVYSEVLLDDNDIIVNTGLVLTQRTVILILLLSRLAVINTAP